MRSDDKYFIQRCLDGDSAAFGFLVDRYKACVYALAYSKLHNFHDAEDITQETFIKAYNSLRTLRKWDDFSVWIHSIASNLCKAFLRSESRRIDNEFIEDQDPQISDDFSLESYQDNLTDELVHDALNSLPEMYQQVLTLYYLGGMDSMEIARFLGIKPTTIRQRINRARSQLREGAIGMMNEAFERKQLKASFTFNIVEMIKQIRIQPISTAKSLPYGISLAAGILAIVFGMGQNLNITNTFRAFTSSISSPEPKILKVGEFPVDIIKISSTPTMSDNEPDAPNLQNALFMSPQAEGGTWTKKAGMLTPRTYVSVCEVGGKIYAIGGVSDEKSPFTLEEYDPIVDRWTKKADKPTPSGSAGTFAWVMDNCIHTLDTWDGTRQQYDPQIDKWTSLKNTDRLGVGTAGFSFLNGKVYVIGGQDADDNKLIFSTVHEYDPVTDTWTKKADMPTPRMMLSTCVNNGKIYAIGGWGGAIPPLTNVEEYDPIADKWTKKANMSEFRHSLFSCAVDGKIYSIGGLGFNVLSTLEAYDPIIDTWTKKANMPTARCHISGAGCVIDGKIYVIGGSRWDWNVLSTVEVYNPKEGQSINFRGKLPNTWGDAKIAESR